MTSAIHNVGKTQANSFVFFGTPYVARDTLELLHEHGLNPSAVITNPDAPRGRGHELTPSETKIWAQEHNLPVLSPQRLDADGQKEILAHAASYAIVVAYGKIFPETLIKAFPKGVLNIHYSLLPAYRGASPVEAALLAGETRTGVTIQKMVHELDAGDILAQSEVAILPDDTTPTLRERLITEGARLLVESLPDFLAGTAVLTPQDHTRTSHTHKIEKRDGEIQLDAPDKTNWNKYRAYAQWPGTYFFVQKNNRAVRVKIADATLTSEGIFKILRVIPEGKKEMAYADYARNNADVL